jgi:hypothetical protein
MRLRYVTTMSFARSELTNWNAILAERPEFHSMRPDDVVAIVSMTGDQIAFLHGFDEHDGKVILRSTRFRIAGSGRWNPLMLANYAKAVGIHLAGVRTYEEHYRHLIEETKKAFAAALREATR